MKRVHIRAVLEAIARDSNGVLSMLEPFADLLNRHAQILHGEAMDVEYACFMVAVQALERAMKVSGVTAEEQP